MNRALLPLLLAVALLAGCRTLDRFSTNGRDSYCGDIVAASFIRDPSYPPGMRLMLQLDMSQLDSVPGHITTDDTLCNGAPLFDHAKLRAMKEVLNDPLSLMKFDDGQDQNILGWVDSSCPGQGTLLAIVSLMKNDNVEVRLLRPTSETASGAKMTSGFALFQLTRHTGTCL